MPFLVIPNEVYANDATIWVAGIYEDFDPATVVLEYGANTKPLSSGWRDFVIEDGKNRIRYQRVNLSNLSPGTSYTLGLPVGGELKADGSMITFPYRLPATGRVNRVGFSNRSDRF